MKRVNTRGIRLANKCMIMAAIAYNLKKMMKFRTTTTSAIARALAHDTLFNARLLLLSIKF